MAYDFEPGTTLSIERKPDNARPKPHPQDLAVIVTHLELAALFLTNEPGATFTREQLIHQVRELAGNEIDFAERDLDIVIQSSGFLKKVGSKLQLK